MKIYQMLAEASLGDATCNHAHLIKKCLTDAGYDNEVYARVVRPNCIDWALPFENVPRIAVDDVVIVHECGGCPFYEEIRTWQGRILLMFHNATPAHYFELYQPDTAQTIRDGLILLENVQPYIDHCIVFSDFSKNDLVRMGYSKDHIWIMRSCMIPFDEYNVQPDSAIMRQYSDGLTNILFVGRLAPNKKQEDIIAGFARYQQEYDPNTRLILVGSESAQGYLKALQKVVHETKAKNVVFPGHISFAALVAIYKSAHLFLCLSEHEGFCIPLVEAMYFRLPIVAYRSSAVPETLAGSGVLLENKSPEQVATALRKVLTDTFFRKTLLEKEAKRLTDLDPEKIRVDFLAYLQEILTQPQIRRPARCLVENVIEEKLKPIFSPQVQIKNDPAPQNNELGKLLSVMASTRENYAFRHIYSCRKVMGPFIVFGKRVVRKLLKWYLEPVCFQQTDFNRATTAVVEELAARSEALSRRCEDQDVCNAAIAQKNEKYEALIAAITQRYDDQEALIAAITQQYGDKEVQIATIIEQYEEIKLQNAAIRRYCDEQEARSTQLAQIYEEQTRRSDELARIVSQQAEELQEQRENLNYAVQRVEESANSMNTLRALHPQIFVENRLGTCELPGRTSQSGEDGVLDHIFDALGYRFEDITYLDLGANHAKYLSNTYYFYVNGSKGVLVEANPSLIPELKFYRNRDVILNRCVTAEVGNPIPFYTVENGDGLSSPDEASVLHAIQKKPDLRQGPTVQVQRVTVNELFETYFEDAPTFVSLDIEGDEMAILCSIDFDVHRPLLYIIEVIPYEPCLFIGEKREDVARFMKEKGYVEYAFTGVNSIFLDITQLKHGEHGYMI